MNLKGFIMKNKKTRRSRPIPKKLPLSEGVLSCSVRGGFGFVAVEGEQNDIYVESDRMGGANHGDRVAVRPIMSRHRGKKRLEGFITKVISREISTVIAVITADFGGCFSAQADDRRFYPAIRIPKEAALGAKCGDRVVAELTAFDGFGRPDGAVIKVLGDSQGLRGRIDALIYKHSIKDSFDGETLTAADKIKDKIPSRELEGRLDLRNEKIFTIDGNDAKDFDDAVSIKKLANGSYRLGVHIADVSHYVRANTPIDREAFSRGTSVYLADRVIPMLPENLSNGVCSLKPECERLTLSCIMTVDSHANVTKYSIKKSVICSLHRMTYENVEKILDGDLDLCREYKDILTPLKNMAVLADILNKKRLERGSIDFDLPESSAELAKDYTVTGISARKRLKSHRIIEEFMLLANETVARHAVTHSLPFVFRTHAAPDTDKLINFNSFLLTFGLSLPQNLYAGVPPQAFSKLLARVEGEPYEAVIAKSMLRSMMKAEYRTSNDGHFGLAAEYYCHFTSPIRRYPDLMVHRILSAELEGRNTKRLEAACIRAAKHSSDTERAAEECEREVDALLKAAYMSEHIGSEYCAVISSLTEYGIYAELDNTIEGMIRLDSIGGDYYYFDESSYTVKGRRTGRKFRIGESVDIVVTGADVDLVRIDFMLKRDYESGLRRNKNNDRRVKYGKV